MPAKFHTPMIAGGGAFIGAGAAYYQVTGNWFSLSPIAGGDLLYVLGVAGVFGIVCGLTSILLNRFAR